jgi:hypothetical protein
MPTTAKEKYQNTTVRLPRYVYEKAKTIMNRSQVSSFNEFVVQAIEEKVTRLTEAEIDAAFSEMAHDSDYQRNSNALAREFEKSDWEAFASSGIPHGHRKATAKTRPSKARSR